MARSLPHTIADNADLVAAPVQENFDDINNRFVTTSNGIKNADIYSAADIATTKLKHGGAVLLSTWMDLEHEAADGSHTFADNGCNALFITPDATAPENKVTITATAVTVSNVAATDTIKVSSVSEVVNIESAFGANGKFTNFSEGASTSYYFHVLYDLDNTNTTGVIHTSAAVTAAQLSAFNTEVAGGANFAYSKLVGYVLNDADSNFELPRPIAGGSYSAQYLPQWPLFASGSFTGAAEAQTLVGVGFKPDVVMIVPQVDQVPCFIKNFSMGTTYSKGVYWGIADDTWTTAAITALVYDGFTIAGLAGWDGVTVSYLAWKIHSGVAPAIDDPLTI